MKLGIISDIHYGRLSRSEEFSVPGEPIQDKSFGSISMEESIVKILKDNSIEYLLISGDLTSVGSPQEFYYCEKKILEIAEKANIKVENIIVGLGNHDIDWNITKLSDIYKEKSDILAYDLIRNHYQLIASNASVHSMETFSSQKFEIFGPAPFSGVIEREELVIFVLNSGWKCAHNDQHSHGKLNSNQLSWLENLSAKYKEDNRWKIVLLHHHPYNYPYPFVWKDISTLAEGSELVELFSDIGVDIVIHGHRHHPKVETVLKSDWIKPINFICSGSFSVNSHERCNGEIPNTFHILDLTSCQEKRICLYNYQYNMAEGWVPIKGNNRLTPIDAKMLIGKIYDNNEVESAIMDLTKKKEVLMWDELPISLQYMPLDKLNTKIRDLLTNNYKIVGSFPSEVVLIEKTEGAIK